MPHSALVFYSALRIGLLFHIPHSAFRIGLLFRTPPSALVLLSCEGTPIITPEEIAHGTRTHLDGRSGTESNADLDRSYPAVLVYRLDHAGVDRVGSGRGRWPFFPGSVLPRPVRLVVHPYRYQPDQRLL